MDGDNRALIELWGRIYVETKRRVFQKLLQSGHSEATDFAHEASVEAFLMIVERYAESDSLRDAFASQEGAQNYMTRVILNWVISWFRRPANRRVFHLEDLEMGESTLSVSVDLDDELERDRTMRLFQSVRYGVTRQWLRGLNAKEVATRQLLRQMKGLTQQEAFEKIAVALDMAPAGVKTRVRRSRERWEQMMLDHLNAGEIG